jgi:DNA-binding NarL/FixJ family response regulator
MTEIRVALVDDHPVVLAGIAALLQSAPDICVVGSAATGADALALIEEHAPDLAVIDISLPDMSGVSLAQTILAKHPEIRIITLTVHESRAYVQSLLLAGVKGYVLKRAAADDLIRAVRAVAAGGVYLDPSVAEQALPTGAADRASSRAGSEELSPREEAVLKFTAQGFSNKEIAGRLEISVKSVETYKARAALKFDLRSRADIVRYGVSRGWLDAINIE